MKQPKKADQLNIRGVYLHVLGDALGSVIVIVNALVIYYASGKWTMYIDPVMSVLMVIIILKTSIPLLKESSMILMQTVPTHLKIKEIQEKLMGQIDGVLSIHEFHIWQLSGNKIIGKYILQILPNGQPARIPQGSEDTDAILIQKATVLINKSYHDNFTLGFVA